MASKHSLLFIPDISGFADFVNRTEINHSQHIISELLEIIIDANQLNLRVSEIEGDAILFYKENDIPSTSQLIEQSKNMFLAFHNQLKKYETQRVCQCGACCTASSLTLKIITHAGEFGFITVKDKKKPHGSDVILVHRLLKNDIHEKEYLLLSGNFSSQEEINPEQNSALKFIEGSTKYKTFGKIKYTYVPLHPFRALISLPPKIEFQNKIEDPLVFEGLINCERQHVFEVISNLDLRLSWNKDVDKLTYKKKRVNRIGTTHTCLVSGKNLDFETVTNDFGENMLVYGERISTLPVVKEFSVYNILEKQGKKTLLRTEIHYLPLPLIGWILLPIFKRIFKKNLPKTFAAIKEVCESQRAE
jgi:hypothetical protein